MKYRIKWVGGATWVMDIGALRFACDPVLCAKGTVQDYRVFKSRRLDDPVYTRDDFKGVDFWLVTHLHEDHLDMRGLAVMGDSPIYSPVPIARKTGTVVLKPGETHQQGGTTITAVPAVHSINPLLGGMIGNGNGYVVEYSEGGEVFTLYVSGDSLLHGGVIRALKGIPIDMAILNAGAAALGHGILSKIAGRITMNRRDIARFDSLFHPGTIVPVHWGTFTHYRERLDTPGVDLPASVKVLLPGETLSGG